MQTLIVYDENPEVIKFYLIPEDQDSDWVVACNGHYVNNVEPESAAFKACMRLNDAICSKLEYCDDQEDPLATKWVQYAVDREAMPTLVIQGPLRVVHTGFYI